VLISWRDCVSLIALLHAHNLGFIFNFQLWFQFMAVTWLHIGVALPAMWWNCKLHQSLLNTKCHPIWCLSKVCTFCLCRKFMISFFWPASKSLTLLHFGLMEPLELRTKTRLIHAYLSMKEGCLFCLSGWDLLNHSTFCYTLGTIGKLELVS